jgi:hypothetical protein
MDTLGENGGDNTSSEELLWRSAGGSLCNGRLV